ncbi:anaerobic sulfatase maturase [Neobacillus sp. OS1-2]|uniref:anaerobic sulfatase maturase n=1 Tax=Neobacillus sp. OS1-2 TaxID=3070680 RepID=UPI0027E0CB93|nr:anaerobic sulfatase maturase [Neobacillus sp. OS1-2]WML41441.1 anaerobic sulfatase maturase [Neobacillus sp. OS1-2]
MVLVNRGIAGVMWKTVSEACNLACDYCYYSRCNGRPEKIERIDDVLLEKFIREYMAIKKGIVPFAWQGGEPLLAGLDFFERVVQLQVKYAPKNTVISNAIQTNGTLLNEEWASFFKKYDFLVGVSLDGPEEINDARRVTGSGKGSFTSIMQGIHYLKEAKVDFNILTVLHEDNIFKAKELMNFYQSEGFSHVQFIPCMDFQSQDITQPGNYFITPKQYGDFFCEAFDVWYNNGDPQISVRFFDNILAVYLHQQAELCTHQQTCPKTIIFEQNGDAYPCDFFIHDQYKLGNLRDQSLESFINNELMEEFLAKKPALPAQCQSCKFLQLCHGGCPRNRIGENNQLVVEYFCQSYKQLYRYAHERMLEVATSVKRQKINQYKKAGHPLPGRNESCICGSTKKFKKCCEALLE